MRLVPVLFPSDLGFTEGGLYTATPERSAPDIVLDLLESEGVRMTRPQAVVLDYPENGTPASEMDEFVARAVLALAESVERINSDGNFPLVLGGDRLALLGHVLGHARRFPEGVGLAVLSTPHLELAATKNAEDMALGAVLGQLGDEGPLAQAMKESAVLNAQTSVLGVRSSESAEVRASEKKAGIEVWRMERLELDGEGTYRSMLNRHLAAGPIVLSIDVRGLDPHLMTAVRAPVSDGIDWSFLKRTLEQCGPHVDRILGLDIGGIDPTKDDASHRALNRFAETVSPFLRKLTR